MVLPRTDVFRLVHDEGDGFPGLTADRLGRAVLVEAHRREADAPALIQALEARLGERVPIFFKERWARGGVRGWQVAGPICHPDFTVEEHGGFYQVRIVDEEHMGLFLDSRPARQRVMALAAGKRVLNLFAYTGAFGVSAALGGATSTTNVDNKRSAVALARRNYQLNGLPHDTRTFLRANAFQYLRRAVRGRGRFDLVILDPPPISKGPGGRRFRAETGYSGLAGKCLRLIPPGGGLLAGLNASRVSDLEFEKMIRRAGPLAGRELEIVDRIGPGEDFPPCRSRPVARFILIKTKGYL